jgi:molecular chaperone HtpG
MESGHISIHAENILPIIKRWLYSEKEIFLRELVSNAADALYKLGKLALVGEVKGEAPEPRITIAIDRDAKTLVITDSGIGMTADEIKKYINQVAFSGLSDFLEKYKDKDDAHQVIGHFGLGFYSSFMVAHKVEIDTLSYRALTDPSVEAAHWSCSGSTDFTLDRSSRTTVGTSITLHVGSDSEEILDEIVLRGLLARYCQFIRYPIYLKDELVNDPTPLWTKSQAALTDKDYEDFFYKLFPGSPAPLFWIHLNMDYPFNLKGILYFPKLKHELDASQGEVKLYSNQVYVADNVKELIPEWLLLLKGVVDCPDLPLNVSRSYLQSDPTVRRIAEHITKKVADKLTGMAKTDRDAYVKYWDDIAPFVKFGMLRDPKFFERLSEHLIFRTGSGKYVTLPEYHEHMKDKLDETQVIYCTDPNAQAAYVGMLEEHGIETVIADTLIDQHFIPYFEMQTGRKHAFKRVDADVLHALVDKTGGGNLVVDAAESKTSSEKLEKLFRDHLDRGGVKIRVERLKTEKVPAMLVFDEQKRRLRDMAKHPSMAAFAQGLVDEPTLVVNESCPAVKNLVRLALGFGKEDEIKLVVNQIYDLAYLQQGELTAEMMQSFVARSAAILGRLGGTGVPQ